jgi:hypothetical protein
MKRIFTSILLTFVFLLCPQQIFAQDDTSSINPVFWKTPYNELSSSDFFIQIGDKRFLGNGVVDVKSDPGLEKSTLELTWREDGVQMRMFMYFQMLDNGMWEMYDLRTYNATGSDWLYYSTTDKLGNPVKSLPGYRNYQHERVFVSKDGSGKIYCKDCGITAFKSSAPPPSIYGYAIDFRIGLPENETIILSTDPGAGYGVNAVLFDSSGNIVTDQSNFSYKWRAENDSVINIYSRSIPYPDGNCAYKILAPCPNFNVQISGKAPGISRVLLDVKRKSDNVIVASNAFTVRVIENTSIPTSSPTIRPSPAPSQEGESISELEELQGEVGRLSLEVNKQQKQLNFLQNIIQSIQDFIRKLFGKFA